MGMRDVHQPLACLSSFRVIQGIVAGPLIPLSQSLLLSNYPPAKRSIALALLVDDGHRRANLRANSRRLYQR
ncbi:Multidrug resistance protein B [Kluyvera cryocrescens]|uniref:Multidrug resistance protein B n=1 Tax=Kluyvera cryocrescens TaxID=580 RepID=A0A485B4W3_KLUCR|nr:Multidrug resistance protein B [Kluyvera cryocrescens]